MSAAEGSHLTDPAGRRVQRRRTALLVGLFALVLTGCTSASSEAAGAHPAGLPSIRPVPPSAPTSVVADEQEAVVAAPAPRSTLLPDRALTPGAVFADVSAADVCRPRYEAGVRRPRFNARVRAFSSYGLSLHDRDRYEVDHLVPVLLGGSNAAANLWPQTNTGPRGANRKDSLETRLHDLVCSHRLALKVAQQALARDWSAAYRTYMPSAATHAGTGAGVPAHTSPAPDAVVNGSACAKAGRAGASQKGVRLTCQRTSGGALRWRKRY